jgi:hypothetical protein
MNVYYFSMCLIWIVLTLRLVFQWQWRYEVVLLATARIVLPCNWYSSGSLGIRAVLYHTGNKRLLTLKTFVPVAVKVCEIVLY